MEEKLKRFIHDLNIIEEAMYNDLKNNSIVLASSNNALKVLDKFQKNIIMIRNEPLLQTPTINDYNNFVSANGIETLMGNLLFKLKRDSQSSIELTVGTIQLFENIAKYMPRLKAIIENLLEEYIKIHKVDELFEPININKQKIISSLDSAILELKKTDLGINEASKKNILIYFNEIKIDVNKENPPWSNIVGKLNIAAVIITVVLGTGTILTSLNDAYDSIMKENFKSTIDKEYIYQTEPLQLESKVELNIITV